MKNIINFTNSIKPLPASYYNAIFNNNLLITGVEERMPQLVGSKTDWENFNNEIEQLGY